MQDYIQHDEAASYLYTLINSTAKHPELGVDGIKTLQLFAGVLIEFTLLMDCPDRALTAFFDDLSQTLMCEPDDSINLINRIPPAHMIDEVSEQGRALFRDNIECWPACLSQIKQLLLDTLHFQISIFEQYGYAKEETFRIIVDLSYKCMAYEFAAQELCDLAIERKIGLDGWSLGDCISGLSGAAGQRAAWLDETNLFDSRGTINPLEFEKNLDYTVSVMTQEAVRLGIPAGTDWRFGLAANDVEINAPVELVYGVEEFCLPLFQIIKLTEINDQAVACAKAAGRMLAVASSGEMPDMPPIISKPLAVAAMTETFKSAFVGR